MGRIKGMRKVNGVWIRPDNNAGVSNTTPKVIPFATELPSPLVEASSDAPVKVQGIHTHSQEEIKHIEVTTGLKYAGAFSCGTLELVPVFLKTDHTEEEKQSKMASIRKGF